MCRADKRDKACDHCAFFGVRPAATSELFSLTELRTLLVAVLQEARRRTCLQCDFSVRNESGVNGSIVYLSKYLLV